ncbi:MAG TPA: phage tail tube protein [Methylophilaceae bacterium]|nr:phage tail tube protein [Methylophilaceae bacterium]
MASSQGINGLLVAKRETTWGTKASASGARYLRRVTAEMQLEKDTYNSNEIRPSQQMSDMRHGTRKATGSLNGELSGSAYDEFMAAALRKDFVAGATSGAVITIASAAGTFTRSSSSFITDGFKVGSVISVSGFTDAGNNGLFLITAISATVLTVSALAGQTQTTEAEGDSITIVEAGKKTFVPLTAHTDDSFTIEQWQPDSTISRTFLGMQVDQMNVSVQPNSMATVDFTFLGKDAETPTSSAYFTSPTAVGGEGTYSGPDGFLFINGVSSDKVTSLKVSIANNIQQEAVIGSNSIGAKARGKLAVTIDGSALFDNDAILGYFDEETEISLTYVLMSADNTEAFAIHMPRVKIGTATVDDGEKVRILSFSGMALEYTAGATGIEATTIQIQDTTLS